MQEDVVKSTTGYLMSRDLEVEIAVDDFFGLLNNYPLDPRVKPTTPTALKKCEGISSF